jgi:hypothetical protein
MIDIFRILFPLASEADAGQSQGTNWLKVFLAFLRHKKTLLTVDTHEGHLLSWSGWD